MTQTAQITQTNNSNFEYNDYNRKRKYDQIYPFCLRELNELTYTELKLYSVIRTLCNGNNYISISEKELGNLVNMKQISRTLINLQKKNKIIKNNKRIYLYKDEYNLDQIVQHEQFLFWVPEDLNYNLTYLEFKIFCILRNYSSSWGFATIKPQTISELIYSPLCNVYATIKILVNKNLIKREKNYNQIKYYITD